MEIIKLCAYREIFLMQDILSNIWSSAMQEFAPENCSRLLTMMAMGFSQRTSLSRYKRTRTCRCILQVMWIRSWDQTNRFAVGINTIQPAWDPNSRNSLHFLHFQLDECYGSVFNYTLNEIIHTKYILEDNLIKPRIVGLSEWWGICR